MTSQSYQWILREAFVAALERLPYFGGFKVRRNKHPGPFQEQDFPALGVYMMPEEMVPDTSDAMGNAGNIGFVSNFRIGFQVLILNNNPDVGEQEIDKAYWAIANGLWRDQYLTGMFTTWNPHLSGYETQANTRFEGIVRGMRRHSFGATGLNNTIPFLELVYEVTVRSREEFAPIITDELLRIHEEVFPNSQFGQRGRDPNNEIIHVEVTYDFTERSLAPPLHIERDTIPSPQAS